MDSVGIVSAAVTMKSFMGDRVWPVFSSVLDLRVGVPVGKPLRIEIRLTRGRNEPPRLCNVWSQSRRSHFRSGDLRRFLRMRLSDLGTGLRLSRMRVSGAGRVGYDEP